MKDETIRSIQGQDKKRTHLERMQPQAVRQHKKKQIRPKRTKHQNNA
jgi:hypothetical protein